MALLAVDVEDTGVGAVLPLVAAGRGGQQQHDRARRDGGAVERDVLGGEARLHRRGPLEAQHLLDRLRDERGVGDEVGALVGVLVEQQRGPPQQPADGLGAGHHQQHREVDGLPAGQAGAGERGEQVVAGLLGQVLEAPVEVAAELAHRGQGDVVDEAVLLVEVEALVDEQPDALAVLARHPEEAGDDAGGDLRGVLLHQVDLAAVRPGVERVEQLAADGADVLLQRSGTTQGERARDQPAQPGVARRVVEDHHPAVDRLGAHQLQDVAVRGAEPGRVLQRGGDVLVARQRPEAPAAVEVDRLPVAHRPPHLVGGLVEDRVHRVVGDARGLDRRLLRRGVSGRPGGGSSVRHPDRIAARRRAVNSVDTPDGVLAP